MTSGHDIRRAREALGLDQYELAKALGVAVSTIYRWEAKRSVGADPLYTDALIQFVRWTKSAGQEKRDKLADRLRRRLSNRLAVFHCLLDTILEGA